MVATPFDYSQMVTAADTLTQMFGRMVSFTRLTSTPANSAQPWRNEQVSQDTTLIGRWAAVVPWESRDDRDAVRYGTKQVVVSASQFPSGDGELYDSMTDADGSVWHLHNASIVGPGSTRVLYVFDAEQ